jgi:secretion/DNA translocation related CpaE-like protein
MTPPTVGRTAAAGVVGVVGARGGVGASTLAAALSLSLVAGGRGALSGRRRHREPAGPATARGGQRVVLVDLDPVGGGLDVHLGIEGVPGVRWPDLAGARGDVSGADLTGLLPTWRGVAVLSGDRWRPGRAPPDVVPDVLDALASVHDAVVLDLDRRGVLDGGPSLGRCTTVLVVTPRDLRSVAGVVAMRDALQSVVDDVRLVVTDPAPGGLGVLEVAHVVDLPVAGSVPWDRRVPALVERGAGPATARGAFGRAVARLAGDLA